MSQYEVKDSGKRIDFETGSKRDTNEGKPRYDLISVFGMRELAVHMAKGAEKYGERNWELGQNTSRSYESALRHLTMWQYDDSENHLAAAVFNIFSIIHVKTLIDMGKLDKSLDDATRFLPKPSNWVEVPLEDGLEVARAIAQGAYDSERLARNAMFASSLDLDTLAREMERRGYAIGKPEEQEPKSLPMRITLSSRDSAESIIAELRRRGLEVNIVYPHDPREPYEAPNFPVNHDMRPSPAPRPAFSERDMS